MMHSRQLTLLAALILTLSPHAIAQSTPDTKPDPKPDQAAITTQLDQAERRFISALHEAYDASVAELGIDDPNTARLLDRIVSDTNPALLINEIELVDLLVEHHRQSGDDTQRTTSLMLKLWERFDEHTEANPRPTETVYLNMVPPGGRYPSGIAPSDITEPDIRAEYEAMLAKNRKNAMQLNRALRAQQAQSWFVSKLKLVVLILSQNLSQQEREDLLDTIEDSGRTGAEKLCEEIRAKFS